MCFPLLFTTRAFLNILNNKYYYFSYISTDRYLFYVVNIHLCLHQFTHTYLNK